MKSNIIPTSEQNKRATEDFINRTKPYFEQLQVIISTKKISFIYDISNNTFTREEVQDTPTEMALKEKISEIRESIMNNVLNY